WLEGSHGAGTDDPFHPELLEGPHVGPVRDGMGRELVLPAVAGDEGHPPAAHGAHRDRRRGGSVGGIDLDLPDVFQKRVEAGAAEDPDPDGLAAGPRAQADFSLEPEDPLDPASGFDEVDEPDDPPDEAPESEDDESALVLPAPDSSFLVPERRRLSVA